MSRILPVYSFDSSALIAGADEWYPVDHFPALWERMDALVAEQRLLIIEEVLEELRKRKSAARTWCESHPDAHVGIETVDAEADEIAEKFPFLTKPGRGRADGWVIALAKKYRLTVVTNEKPTGSRQDRRPKIPDVCALMGIPVLQMQHIARVEGWRF